MKRGRGQPAKSPEATRSEHLGFYLTPPEAASVAVAAKRAGDKSAHTFSRRVTVAEALKATPTDRGCIEWTGSRHGDGYGLVSIDGQTKRAHRVAWELANGAAIPEGLYVLHSCDNPPCINPAHLRLGTAADNAQDAVDRKRGIGAPSRAGAPTKVCGVRVTEDEYEAISRASGSEGPGPFLRRVGLEAARTGKSDATVAGDFMEVGAIAATNPPKGDGGSDE